MTLLNAPSSAWTFILCFKLVLYWFICEIAVHTTLQTKRQDSYRLFTDFQADGVVQVLSYVFLAHWISGMRTQLQLLMLLSIWSEINYVWFYAVFYFFSCKYVAYFQNKTTRLVDLLRLLFLSTAANRYISPAAMPYQPPFHTNCYTPQAAKPYKPPYHRNRCG